MHVWDWLVLLAKRKLMKKEPSDAKEVVLLPLMITDEAWWWALMRELWAWFYIHIASVACHCSHHCNGSELGAADRYRFHCQARFEFMVLLYNCGLACKCRGLPFHLDSITSLRVLLNRLESCNCFNGIIKCCMWSRRMDSKKELVWMWRPGSTCLFSQHRKMSNSAIPLITTIVTKSDTKRTMKVILTQSFLLSLTLIVQWRTKLLSIFINPTLQISWPYWGDFSQCWAIFIGATFSFHRETQRHHLWPEEFDFVKYFSFSWDQASRWHKGRAYRGAGSCECTVSRLLQRPAWGSWCNHAAFSAWGCKSIVTISSFAPDLHSLPVTLFFSAVWQQCQ